MTELPTGFDPYASPGDPAPVVADTGLSTGLKTIAIIAVVLGAFGLVSVMMGVVGLALNRQLQSVFNAGPTEGDGNAAARFQQDLQKRLAVTTERFLPASLVILAAKLGVAVLLLTGGIMVLLLKPSGRGLLRLACGLAIFYELAATALNTVIQVTNLRIMKEMTDGMLGGAPGGGRGGPPPEMFSKIMTIAMFAGLAFAVALALVKIVFYVFSVVHLGKPAVRARFEAKRPPAGENRTDSWVK